MKKLIFGLTIFVIMIVASVGIMYANKSDSKAASVSDVKNIKKSLFTDYTSIKTTIPYGGDRDTAQGMAVVNNVIYSAKLHADGTTTLIKTVKQNGKVKHIMPVKNLDLGHANDITYYNGYLYQTTSDNEDTGYMNKISEYYIGTNYNNLQAMYSISHYGTFDDWQNKEKFEIERIDFDNEGKLYISVNVAGRRDYIYVSKNKIEM